MSTPLPEDFKASQFRSAASAKILRGQAREHSDFNFLRWTRLAITDLSKFAHLKDSTNGNQQRTWRRAVRRMREGVELFGDTFWPLHGTVAAQTTSRSLFCQVTMHDIIDMAVLEANAE